MDEALKRRLVGVLVVVVAVFIISLLLPHPGTVSTDENNQRVTLDLTGKEPEPIHTAPTPVPPVIAAAPADSGKQAAATPDNDNTPPQIEEPPVTSSLPAESMTDDEPGSAKAQKPADVVAAKPAAKPKPEAVVAAAAPEKPAPVKAESKPALKLEDSLKKKPAAVAPAKPAEKVPPKVVAKTPEVPTKAAPAPVAKPAATANAKAHWLVQVGAFNDIAKARQVLDKLSLKGLKGIISPLDSAKGTLYRVRIGPLASRDQAKQAQDQAAKLGFAGSSIIED
jgi:DedD protein